MTTLEHLQGSYDLLVAARSRAIRRYDDALDGTAKKRAALRDMDKLGERIREVEREIAEAIENAECLDAFGDSSCEGAVEYRQPLSATGRSFPRCEKHWHARLVEQERINARYPATAPADFDPSYAGEQWDED